MVCNCSLAGTAACLTCRNRPVITGNVFREVLGKLGLEVETKRVMFVKGEVMNARGNINLFDRVECIGYLKRKTPQWNLVISDAENFKGHFHSTGWINEKYHNEDIAVNFEDEHVTNTYYEEKEQRFGGVVIGFRDVVTEAKLYAVTDDYPDGSQKAGCYKESTNREPCAIVAYGDNRKHIVPLRKILTSDTWEGFKE